MSELLRLSLLGTPQIRIGDRTLNGSASYKKTEALLFYLAATASANPGRPVPHSRNAIASLLWNEQPETQARQSLRTVLSDLRRLVGDHVRIDRQTVVLDSTSSYWLDVEVFRRALASSPSPMDLAKQQAVIDLYQGEFLHGFYVRDAPAFEAWVLEQREQLHILAVNALTALVDAYARMGDAEAALATNRQLLTLDPWSEPTHRLQMRLLAQTGDRAAALAQYETCRHMLATEFDIAPLPETTALYEQIRAGEWEGGEAGAYRTTEAPHPDAESELQSGVKVGVKVHYVPFPIKLYGRQAELASLHRWIVAEGCQMVGIFGIGGQGKTTLAASFAGGLAEASPAQSGGMPFTHIIWQSLLNAPPLAEVLQEWVSILSDQMETTLPASLDQQINRLLDYLRRQPCLLILDNLESILRGDEHSGSYLPGYEAYGQLLRRLAESEHKSCLLLTSRERLPELTAMEQKTPIVRTLSLTGLPTAAGRQMLEGRGLAANLPGLDALVQHYSGNPLALQLVTETVQEIFGGDITAFLQAEALVFDDIRHVLDQQFARLTPLEGELMRWLAIVREPIPFHVLRDLLAQPPAARRLLEAVRSLQRRSLIEKLEQGFELQNVVLEYTTELLIEEFARGLLQERVAGWQDDGVVGVPGEPTGSPSVHPWEGSHLNRHALVLAQAKEYVRASQARLLLRPVLERLLGQLGGTGAHEQLRWLLAQVQRAPSIPGYAAANLLHLLLELDADLRGDDFSNLYLRQAYLRGVSLPQTNFAGSELVDCVFTEPFGLAYAVGFSPNGEYVAAGTSEGAIYIWHTDSQKPAHVIEAHQHTIRQLTFAQSGAVEGEQHLVLASASEDRSVGLWFLNPQGQLHRHIRLSHPEQEALVAVGLHPDGQRVISVDIDGSVFIWDVHEQREPQLVHHFATAFTRIRLVAFSPDGQTVVIGHRDGTVRLWHAETGALRLQLESSTGLIFTLAWSRDGRMLATGGREGHLSLWRLPTGELHQVIETNGGAIRSLAFSPDGKFLASGHEDLAIRVWSIDSHAKLHLQRTLRGHTQTIWSVAFGPSLADQLALRRASQRGESPRETRQLLVTGSSDQTVRVWDVETGHTLYMLRGQPRVLAAHVIHQLPPAPPGDIGAPQQSPEWLLAAAGYDQLIHLWQGRGNAVNGPHRVLRGANGPLYAVAVSPDGRHVVAGGYDMKIYLWDREGGQLRQILHGHTNCVYSLAFHPDGKLLASGSGDGTIRLWSVAAVEGEPGRMVDAVLPVQPVAVLQADLDVVHDLDFSPDGRILARGGSDHLLRVWDMTQSHYPELIEERRVVQDESEEDIFAVAFSPDGSTVACSGNHYIHLVHAAREEVAPLLLQHHTAWIYSVAFSPDGETLASSGADCTVCLWDAANGTLRAVLRGHGETVYKVAFTPDGSAVVSSSFDGTIRFWDSQSGDCLNTVTVEGPYAGMNITDVTGLTEAQMIALKALGAVESAGPTVQAVDTGD